MISDLVSYFYNSFNSYHAYFTKTPNNFYYLSLIKELDNTWSIHGLWPQYSKDSYPSFCKNVEFNYIKIIDLLPELKSKWYTDKGYDIDFWSHEYLKHGTCNFNNLDEHDYFKKTLELYDTAILQKLPEKYYNSLSKKCLIPVNQQFEFFECDFN